MELRSCQRQSFHWSLPTPPHLPRRVGLTSFFLERMPLPPYRWERIECSVYMNSLPAEEIFLQRTREYNTPADAVKGILRIRARQIWSSGSIRASCLLARRRDDRSSSARIDRRGRCRCGSRLASMDRGGRGAVRAAPWRAVTIAAGRSRTGPRAAPRCRLAVMIGARTDTPPRLARSRSPPITPDRRAAPAGRVENLKVASGKPDGRSARGPERVGRGPESAAAATR